MIAMCNALGGTWGGGKCALAPPPSPKPTTGSCGSGEAMTGVDGNGDAVCVALSAGQSTAPGVPPGCFPVKSELKRMAGSWNSGQEPTVKGSGPACPATYGVTRSLLGQCMYPGLRVRANDTSESGRGHDYTCVLNSFCCLN